MLDAFVIEEKKRREKERLDKLEKQRQRVEVPHEEPQQMPEERPERIQTPQRAVITIEIP